MKFLIDVIDLLYMIIDVLSSIHVFFRKLNVYWKCHIDNHCTHGGLCHIIHSQQKFVDNEILSSYNFVIII